MSGTAPSLFIDKTMMPLDTGTMLYTHNSGKHRAKKRKARTYVFSSSFSASSSSIASGLLFVFINTAKKQGNSIVAQYRAGNDDRTHKPDTQARLTCRLIQR